MKEYQDIKDNHPKHRYIVLASFESLDVGISNV